MISVSVMGIFWNGRESQASDRHQASHSPSLPLAHSDERLVSSQGAFTFEVNLNQLPVMNQRPCRSEHSLSTQDVSSVNSYNVRLVWMRVHKFEIYPGYHLVPFLRCSPFNSLKAIRGRNFVSQCFLT
jgi:hypothetical protein